MPTTERFDLAGPVAGRLHGIVDLPDRPGERPAVVICHGFKAFMEWGFYPPLAELLVQRGFVVVRFNFSGSGMVSGEDRVSDLEGFRTNTFSREQADLRTILGAVGTTLAPGRADPERLGLFGHSRGGAAAILTAGSPEWRDRIGALVTWSAIATLDRVSGEERAAWRRDGQITVVNSRTGQELPIGVVVLDDLEAHREALDVTKAAGRVGAPWLIVHGEADETVPVREARRLYAAAGPPQADESPGLGGPAVELETVPEAGHTFGAVHPFAGPTPQLTRALNATQGWLKRNLEEISS